MKKAYSLVFVLQFLLLFAPQTTMAQCLTWSSPSPPSTYIDFNTIFLGAPCNSGSGCPFNEITDFEVFASEAYSCSNFKAGGTYAFSICNGFGAGSWVPEFTIIAPSGAVDAYGPGDGDSCTITWTASENGTYTIVINEAGHCPGGPNTNVGNGNPALTCISGAPCSGTACSAGVLTTTVPVQACGPNATFSIATDGSEVTPVNGGHGWYFNDLLGGTGGLPGGFTLTNVPYSGTFNADLNGILSSNSLPPLAGTWVVKSVTYILASNPSGTVCNTSADSLIVSFSPTAPPTVVVMDNGNGSATATAAGGTSPYSFLWSNGQTTATATALPTGDYSVVVTDANGCTGMASVSVVSGVANIATLDELTISPNPTSGQFLVKIELNSVENVVINILDVTGREVDKKTGTTSAGSFLFDLSGNPAGVYFMKISVAGEFLTRKIVRH